MVSFIIPHCFHCICEKLTVALFVFLANVKSRSAIKKRQKGGLIGSTNRSGNQSGQSGSSDGADSRNRNSNKSKFLKSVRHKFGQQPTDGSQDDQSESYNQGSLVSDSVERSQRSYTTRECCIVSL